MATNVLKSLKKDFKMDFLYLSPALPRTGERSYMYSLMFSATPRNINMHQCATVDGERDCCVELRREKLMLLKKTVSR